MTKFVQVILIMSTCLTSLIYTKNYLPEHINNIKKELKIEEAILYKKIYDIQSRIYHNIIQYKKNKQKIKNAFSNYNEIKLQLKDVFTEMLSLDEIHAEINNLTQIIIQEQSLTEEQRINFFEKIYNIVLINNINSKFMDQKTKALARELYNIKIINCAENRAINEFSKKFSIIETEIWRFKFAKMLANLNNENNVYKLIKKRAKTTFKNDYATIKANIKQAIDRARNSSNIKHEFEKFVHILFITPEPQSHCSGFFDKDMNKIYDKFRDIVEDLLPGTLDGYDNDGMIIYSLTNQMIENKFITYLYQELTEHIEVYFKEKQIYKS